MATVDWSNVKIEWNRTPPEYTVGDIMIVTKSGQAKVSSESTETTETGALTAEMRSAGGVTTTITAPTATLTRVEPGGEVVLEDVTLLSIADDSGRAWTVSGNVATAVA